MRQTVVGVFDRYAAAQRAVQVLQDSGFGPDAVHITEQDSEVGYADRVDAAGEVRRDDESLTAKIRHFFSDLFGPDDEREVSQYSDALKRGCAVVKVDVEEDDRVDAARQALQSAGAVDIEEQVRGRLDTDVGMSSRSASDAGSATPGGSYPVVDDEVGAGGSQSTYAGGVRVYPDRAVAQSAAAREQGVQSERSALEGSLGQSAGDTMGVDTDYRTHFDGSYASLGERYEDYEPAYRYGSTLARDSRYAGRSWDEFEPDARRDWEGANPGSAWERFKGAVRHAWERATH